MIAFDTDVLSDIFRGRADYQSRLLVIPSDQQSVPIVVADEMLRGQLASIRNAEAGKGRVDLIEAYKWFQSALRNLRAFAVLPWNDNAEHLVDDWQSANLKIGIRDLRIAAIAKTHDATLVSRNRRHFNQVPGLKVEFWT